MSHGTGTTDRVKVSDAAGNPVETVNSNDRLALGTHDRAALDEMRAQRLILTEIRDLLLMALSEK